MHASNIYLSFQVQELRYDSEGSETETTFGFAADSHDVSLEPFGDLGLFTSKQEQKEEEKRHSSAEC